MSIMARTGVMLVLGIGTALAISGCDRGAASSASAPPANPASVSTSYGGSAAASRSDRYAQGGGARYSRYDRGQGQDDRPPAPLFHGEPEWSQNRQHTAQENAQYHFERAGADLGAKTLDDFLTKVHRFCDHPPAGTLSYSRANGDRLLYDPKDNLFAVVTRDGAPRTVFKPSNGMEYWNEQKAREEAQAGGQGSNEAGYRRRTYRRRDDDRGADRSDSGRSDRSRDGDEG